MPRKGNAKVRTGCLTCKVRKIKCDEGKPSCRRCTSTGRKCDGYVPPSAKPLALAWHRPRYLFPNVDDGAERRCLAFFCEVAAPVLSGPLDPYFWTHLILQFSHMEPAVRHSVVAVGSLYEQLYRHKDMTPVPTDNNLALSHYNSAIRHLRGMKNESLVLLVCILFVCIEFLRDDRAAAMQHGQHGLSILKRVEETFPWVKTYLTPLFRRLSLLPYFFSAMDRPMPNLLSLEDTIPPFSTLGDAQFYFDGILSRTVRLIRRGDVYRLGPLRNKPVPPDLISEQDRTRTLLDEWHSSFVQLVTESPELTPTAIHRYNMSIRYLICRVWVETPFAFYETVYDEHLHLFRSMVDSAAAIACSDHCAKPIKFTFEMGYIPLLYFLTTKCRCLETRLRALSLMKRLGAARENLWEIVTMFASAKRIVEIEHGATLTDEGELYGEPSCPGFPQDEMRVRDFTSEPQPVSEIVEGVARTGRLGGFFMRTAEGSIYARSEFLPQPSWTLAALPNNKRITSSTPGL